MQVSVENIGELVRQMTVEVPEEPIASKVKSRLASLSQTARMDGFRRGKVPMKLIQKRFGPQVRQEILAQILQSSFEQALKTQDLRPAGEPEISPAGTPGEGGLKYTATFEIYPEIELTDPAKIQIQRPLTDIGEDEIDQMIEVLRRRNRQWHEVPRAAREGDKVNFDYQGLIDGNRFDGGQ